MGHVSKIAATDFPIHKLLAERWSPDTFADRPVSQADLCSLFEAARWAPSSHNEQPWSYIVATKDVPEQFQAALSCLTEGNRAWANSAPVLAFAVVRLKLLRNGKDNRAAVHDLGLASSNLVVEATSRGFSVHQMIGILPEKARDTYGIPEGWEVWTAMAIGYLDDLGNLADMLEEANVTKRKRKKLSEFVFSAKWGNPSTFLSEQYTRENHNESDAGS
jgi:nitroreductase